MKKTLASVLVLIMLLTALPLGALPVRAANSDATEMAASARASSNATEYNGHYYQVFDDGITWEEANRACQEKGGHLATITSQEEQDFLTALLAQSSKPHLFLGAKATDGRTFAWVTAESFEYTNWSTGEPNNLDQIEYYLMMYNNDSKHATGTWNDTKNEAMGLDKCGYVCEWDSSLDLERANIENQISDINLGPYALKGATINILGNEIPLINIEANIKLNLGENLKIDTAADGAITVLVGFDQDASADMDGAQNSTAYWSESYREVKAMYQQLTGKAVDTTRLWNQFSSMRGKLKTLKANMVVDVDASLMGYMEFKPQNGSYQFSEGGILAEFSANADLRSYYGPVYVFLGIGVGVDGSLSFTKEDDKINPQITVEPSFSLSAGAGIGGRKTYAEVSAYGTLSAILATGSSTPFSAGLDLGVRGKVYLLGCRLADIEKSLVGVQLYPDLGGAWPKTYRLLNPGTDVTTKAGYEKFINSGEQLGREYLQTTYSLKRSTSKNSTFNGASFVKDYSYLLNAPQIVSFNNGTMLLVWIDDTGEKSGSNIGSLMYSYYDGSEWSVPTVLFEDGTFSDIPAVCSDGTNAYIVWQKANKTFEEDTNYSDMLPYFDLYFTAFDSSTQTFIDKICLTPESDSAFEFYPTIDVANGMVTVAWAENSDNNVYQMSGLNTVKTVRMDSDYIVGEKTEVITTEQVVNDIDLADSSVYYTLYTEGNNTLYRYVDGQTSVLCTHINDFDCENGKVFYSNDVGLYAFDGKNTTTYDSVGSLQNFTIKSNGKDYILFTEQINEDFSKTLYYSKMSVTNNSWSKFEVYADRDKFINDYMPVVLADGSIYVAVNYTNDGETQSGALVVERCTEDVDIALSYVVFDASQLSDGTVDLVLGLENNTSTEINVFSLQITDDEGNIISTQIVDGSLSAFGNAELSMTFNVPVDAGKRLYYFTVLPAGYSELDEDNNTKATTFECIHLPSEEFVIEVEETPTSSAVRYQVCEHCNARMYYYACGENLTHTYTNICDSDCNVCGNMRNVQGHRYDNACDSVCNNCGEERISSEHVYDTVCDEYCNVCGCVRETEPHNYQNNEGVKCDMCGMVRSSLLSVYNFEDNQLNEINVYQQTKISKEAAHTGAYGLHLSGDGGWGGLANHYVETVPGHKYVLSFWLKVNSAGVNFQIRDSVNGTTLSNKYYGENYSDWSFVEVEFTATSTQTLINFSGSGTGTEESVYIDDICLTAPVLFGGGTSISEDVNGLAFIFNVSATNGQVVNGTRYVNGSAQITPSFDGQQYKLVRVGAVVSNVSNSMLSLESVNGITTIDIHGVYLYTWDESGLSYAVRIINIPVRGKGTDVSARPYYVYEKDGEEIVVYGNVVTKSYNNAFTYNGDFETGDKSGWSCNSGTATIVTDSHSGKYALQLANPSAWGNAAIRTFNVKPNTQYEVSWYAKRVSGTGAFNLLVTQAESPYTAFTKIAGQNWMTETSGDWVKYSCVYNTDENTQMQLKFTSETDSAGTIIIDDVVVSEWYPAAISRFEDGSTDGWANAYNTLSVVTGESDSGNYCLMFDTTCADWSYAYKRIIVDGNADCKISFKMKSNLSYPIIIRLMTSGWVDICDVQITPTTDWAEYTVTLNSAQYCEVLLMLQSYVSASAGQVFWFDDISYEPC